VRFRPASLLAIAFVVAVLPPATAQQPNHPWLQQTHGFRRLLYERQLQPLSNFDELAKKPAKTILIVLGDTRILDDNQQAIEGLVENGLALFVATDHDVPSIRKNKSTWARYFGIRSFSQPVLGDSPEDCYQRNEQCPFIDPMDGANPNLFAHLTLPVAANRAGNLTYGVGNDGRQLSCVTVFRGQTSYKGDSQQNRRFGVAGKWGDGRVLFLADHSIFINNMLLQEDLDNLGFALNCLDWLRGGRGERRDRVLFYDDGNPETQFDVPIVIPPPRLPDDLTKLANDVLAGLENENKHNELLLDLFQSEASDPFRRFLAFLLSVLTLMLGVYLIRRLWRSRVRLDAGAPLLTPTLARYPPASAGLSQRHKALLADGNLWEPARALARDFFETALGTHEPPAQIPPYQASENWLTRRFLDKLLHHLWRLAYGKSPERIVPSSFAHLAAQLDELKAALADGSLRFQTPATS
jgi:hypothetical protein